MNSFYNLKPERRGVKQFVLTTFLLLFGALFFKATAQVSVTATSATTGPTTYTTVNAAFAAINAGTHQGAITIMVTANTTETAPATQLLSSGTGSSVYTSILIQPQGNVTINSAAVPTASRGILEFIGADNVTIDGDDPLTTGERNLTIQVAVTTNASTACVRFSSASATANGCLNVIVKNCNIVGGRSSAIVTTASYGIYSGSNTVPGTVTTVTGAADNDNMLIENNNITRCYYGIYTYGLSAYPQDNLVIRNNVIGTNVMADNVGLRGILTAFTQATPTANSVIIEGNDIRVGDTLSGYSASVAGIDIATTNAGAVIRNNNIHDVAQPTSSGYGAYGITLSNASANAGILIYNNFIRDITAFHYSSTSTSFTNYGIFSSSAVTNLRILHNTIVLNKLNTGSGNLNFSACIYLSSTTATITELRNNILVNNQSDNTGQACSNIFLGSATTFSSATAINRNNYWVSGVSGYAGRIGTVNYTTLNSFKAVTFKDSNSLNFAPNFVSSTDLHFQSGGSSPFESVGDTTWLTTDYDGNVRPGPLGSVNGGGFAPDLGADEADMGLPSIASVGTGATSNITTVFASLGGNIINNGGSNVIASGIVLSTSPAPVRGAFGVIDSATNPVITSGVFTVNIGNLTLGTTYYYRAYAVNSIGTAYGPDSTFTTNAANVIPTVLKAAATNLQAYTATVGGNITSNGGDPVLASGIVYSTTPMPVLSGLGVVDSTTNPLVALGTYSKPIGGLTHSTKYYYRAYATNSIGTAYSLQDSFTTSPVVSNLPYMQNFDSIGNTGWGSEIVTGTLNNWVVGAPTKTIISGSYSAPNAWITGLAIAYENNHDAVLVSPQFDFTGQTSNTILRFKHKFATEACCDGGYLEISIGGGAWTKIENVVGTGANFNTINGTAWYNG
ncbi:MAG: hypothetical protein KBG11_11095, partial [Bacteroidia bacterium]|nr:hypothetical protein [Bacteroidia bacterium]